MGDSGAQSTQSTPRGFAALKQHAADHKIEVTLWLSRLLNIVFTHLYFLPIFGAQFPAHQKALLSGAITSALRLYQRQPRISLSREYLFHVCSEDSFHYLAYCLLFATTRPISLALVPVFLFSLVHFASYSLTLLDTIGPNSWWAARLIISVIEFQSMNILQLIALSEIFLTPYIVILTITGHIAFTTVFVFYQFLMLRCRSRRNPYTRNMLHVLRLKVENVAKHRLTPVPVQNLIFYLINLLCKIGWYDVEAH